MFNLFVCFYALWCHIFYFGRIIIIRQRFASQIHKYKFFWARARPGPERHEGLARPSRARPSPPLS